MTFNKFYAHLYFGESIATTWYGGNLTFYVELPESGQSLDARRLRSTLAAREPRGDAPLRARSVCLAERPRSRHARSTLSADPNRLRGPDKQFFHHRPPSVDKKTPKPAKVPVKPQKRKTIEKIPCAISIQTLSIPMKYASDHSTSQNYNAFRIDSCNRTKSSNPKQVGDKRLCQSGGGSETENKLLLQISEADQVSDFERILNSNAILCERAREHVWRGATQAPDSPRRPRSSYSLLAVSKAYHFLFRRHEEALQPLVDQYRCALADDEARGVLGSHLDHLQDLREFYEDDHSLQDQVDSTTDHLISEEIHSAAEQCERRQKNFNVNLAGLIDLHVRGEACSPVPAPSRDDQPAETDDEEEWLAPSMSADDRQQDTDSVDCLAQSLDGVKLDRDAKIPTITYSNCSEVVRSELPNNSDVVIHLAVPAIDSIDETRPPMM